MKQLPFLHNLHARVDRLITSVYKISTFTAKAYLEPSRTSMMKLFSKIVNGSRLLTIFAKKLHHRCSTGF